MITPEAVRHRYQNDPEFHNLLHTVVARVGPWRAEREPAEGEGLTEGGDILVFIATVLAEHDNRRLERVKLAIADTLRTLMGAAAAGPYLTHLERAIDTLDKR